MCYRDAAPVSIVAQYLAVIAQRLGPAHRRCVLGADAPAGRQHTRPVQIRKIEDYADVTAVTQAPLRIMVELSASSSGNPRASSNGRER